MTDTIPVLSQVKSILQLLFGQTSQALETQVNFVDATPLLSQLKSIYEIFISKDLISAIDTQKNFLIITNATIDAIPLIGHIKGLGHYVIGDFSNGHNAMKRSSRTTVVILCGYFACTIVIPATATLETTCAVSAIGSIIGGASMDTLITLIENVMNKDGSLSGSYNTFAKVLKNPFDVGSIFDFLVGPLLDGVIGAAVGFKMYQYTNAPLPPPPLHHPPPPPPFYPTPLKIPLPPPPVHIHSLALHVHAPPLPLPTPFNPFIPNMHQVRVGLRCGTAASVLQRHAKHN